MCPVISKMKHVDGQTDFLMMGLFEALGSKNAQKWMLRGEIAYMSMLPAKSSSVFVL